MTEMALRKASPSGESAAGPRKGGARAEGGGAAARLAARADRASGTADEDEDAEEEEEDILAAGCARVLTGDPSAQFNALTFFGLGSLNSRALRAPRNEHGRERQGGGPRRGVAVCVGPG